jgi:16S rRNA (adenine(1408)-N(1))-methyltransferase
MAENSRKAACSLRKGGVPNALFGVASVEHLPNELRHIAHNITINYPWGSLLRAIVAPDFLF